MSDINDHRIITAFDIYKDAKLFSGTTIEDADNLKNNIIYITNISEEIVNIKKQYETIKSGLLSFNTIVKTPITSIETIDEDKEINDHKEEIKKKKPKFLEGPKFFFYDAGSDPTKFCIADNCNFCETIAS